MRNETQQSFIPNSKEVVTALIPNFPPADKTAVVIFYEICIIGVGFRGYSLVGVGFRPSTQPTSTSSSNFMDCATKIHVEFKQLQTQLTYEFLDRGKLKQ